MPSGSLLVCMPYFIISFQYIIIFVFLHLFADEELASLNMIKSAPVGPVAGGIMGCIMVLVLAVYAYRHQIHRRSHQHMSPLAAQGESGHLESKSESDSYLGLLGNNARVLELIQFQFPFRLTMIMKTR